ncbi:hypothetical protein PLEOSDRAFT_162890 [Pleurotus ostreatus PC15]|uniref:Uncharacterized protein n=1 Tax=Pleurotus ostreatus (strain PC15) TaxID=1137138 RepID=A0A067NH29_PLEO1|nr:hypothetical protein PLEOSDRAFT_162890 [Pleurotus ostreatus PC15]
MPSFKTIFSIATFAFAAFAAAAPTPQAASPSDFAVTKRTDDAHLKSLEVILTETTSGLKPLCNKLTDAIGVDIEIELEVEVELAPIIKEITTVLKATIAEVKLLVGHVIEVDVKAIAVLVGELLTLLFCTLGAIVKVVGKVKGDILLPLVGEVLKLVTELLALVLSLVGGLLVCLLPTILKLIPFILQLNIAGLLDGLLPLLGLGGLLH